MGQSVEPTQHFRGSAWREERLRQAAEGLPFMGALHDLAVDQPTQALQAVVRMRASLADVEALAVAVARANGIGWRDLGPPLGKSWHAVYSAYRHVDGKADVA